MRQTQTMSKSVASGSSAIPHQTQQPQDDSLRIQDVPALVPHLRGWLHLGTLPAALALGIVLIVLTPSQEARWSVAVFTYTSALLFGVSAVYHRIPWSPRVKSVLQRLDHANIFLIIAGTYTPFAVVLLSGAQARITLISVWAGAAAGVLCGVLWPGAPRWLYVPAYLALGWFAVGYLPTMWHTGGAAIGSLMVIGGVLYSVGGLVYGAKWPNPSPRWFGFHEVFHAFTVAAFIVHCVGIALTVLIKAA